MSTKLSDLQKIFAYNIAKLIIYINDELGMACTFGETYRTPEQASIYAKQGKGVRSSLHCDRLACDLNLFNNGQFLTNSEEYAKAGAYWKSLDAMNKWGGDFVNLHDGNHFSMSPDGIRG